MSRPQSAKRPQSGKLRRQVGDAVSYEDLLVAQYLEELRKAPQNGTKSSALHHNKLIHIVPAAGNNMPMATVTATGRVRPYSAVAAPGRPKSGYRARIDSKFVVDSDWDSTVYSSPRVVSTRRRPQSAPSYRRPLSATYGSMRPGSAKSSTHGYGRKVRSLYKKQPQTIVATAFKNGSREIFHRIAAPNLKMLLEICTDKLGLSAAARRIFLDDGTEVFTAQEIPRDADIFLSMGEPFRDPFKGAKKNTKQQRTMDWTINGLVWSADAKRKSTRSRLSKRFRSLIEQSRRRVLIFKNGHGSEGVEIVANPEKFEDFLVACTAKLDMGSYARVLYDWEGNEINDLKDAPVLDACLQTWSTPVLGPLWVSKGEGFSPKGVQEFLKGLITYTKSKLKEAKHYKQQLEYARREDGRNSVEIAAILSMSEAEIDETLEIVVKDVEDFSNALNRLKQQMSKIEGDVNEEEAEGHSYTLKHINQFKLDHKLCGPKGLRLKIYENGTYEEETIVYFNWHLASRGVGHDQKKILSRLLDQCSSSHKLANPKQNTAMKAVAQKLFNKYGIEITNVFELEYDTELWLSFGEPFKNPFTFVMTAQFDKCRVFNFPEQGKRCIREQLMSEDVSGKDKCGMWVASIGVHDDISVQEVAPEMDPMEREHMTALMDTSEIAADNTFLKAKDRDDWLIFPDVVVDNKKKKGSKDIWPSEAQNWVISKSGMIYSKAFPQLVLAVTPRKVTCNLKHPILGDTDVRATGFQVGLAKRSNEHSWTFTGDGLIYNSSHPDLFLTYLGGRFGDEGSFAVNEEEGHMSGHQPFVAVCERLPTKDGRAQRWAIKQENLTNMGQWKHSKVENPEWNKKAYSWPVEENGDINEDFDWPMEGYFIPYAPPMKKPKEAKISQQAAPLRLMVMKNGVRDITKSVAVVGPDLTNMKKDMKTKDGKKKKKHSHGHPHGHHNDTDSLDVDEMVHCEEDLTVLKLEFILFLERCTTLLDLPFAARRIFDQNGKEHFSLRSLRRDELIYVSCGEPWTDPTLSKAEQQRRYLLANLAADVAQIRQYVALRNPKDLCLEVEGNLIVGAKVIVNQNALTADEEETNGGGNLMGGDDQLTDEQGIQDDVKCSSKLSHHEMSHIKAEERLNNRKWPWQREGGDVEEEDDPEAQNYSNKELYHRFSLNANTHCLELERPKKRRPTNVSLQLQKFRYEDGYISCEHDSDLVLGVSDAEGRIIEVVLTRRRPDDIMQRWNMGDNGLIQAKYNPNMVMTVSMPTMSIKDESGMPVTYTGCQVTLQHRKLAQFGRANQKWSYDTASGFIFAFAASNMDKEITAANKANICTYTVMGATKLDQSGYIVDVPIPKVNKKTKQSLVCAACARAMRGRYKLERVTDTVDFSCAMGTAKEHGVKQMGSFQCLNGKIDLSTHEAQHTLEEWEGQLIKLREELSVRVIAKEISAARVPYTVKVLAYKNGEGRRKPGELVVGSSVPGLLQQCTARLGLNQAARRMYAADGMIVLDMDDLITWVQERYIAEAREKLREEAKQRRQNKKSNGEIKDKNEASLMSKVHFEETSEEESEDEEEDKESEVNGAEQEEDEPIPEGEFVVGHEVKNDRLFFHQDLHAHIIIPNQLEDVRYDGFITAWNFYAKIPGNITLMVFRPDKDNLNAFTVVDQVELSIDEAGQYTVDIENTPNPQWAGKGMEVRKGDTIGFHCDGMSMIPYDQFTDFDVDTYVYELNAPPEVGTTYNMKTLTSTKNRQYSVSAVVRPVKKEPKPSREPKSHTSTTGKSAIDSVHDSPSQNGVKKEKRKRKQPHIDPPPPDMVLKYPIEVWISSGENFVKPENVEKQFEKFMQMRKERAAVSYELDKQKHVLRQMQGRRYDEMKPGEYKSTMNPTKPVSVEGHWQDPTPDEQEKHDTVHQLQTHLQEMKAQQKKTRKRLVIDTSKRLYTQPTMKRALIFPNGESMTRAVYVWGETMQEILDNAATRLNMRKTGKYLYTVDGQQISDVNETERDQLLCVGYKGFMQPKDSRQNVEIKANWGRARRQYGPNATDIVVSAKMNPEIDVDPFGPSHIAGGGSSRPKTATGRKHSSGSDMDR